MKVKEIMSNEPLKTCNPETKLSNATLLMKESNKGALPVLNNEQKVIGILTDRDVCLGMAGHPTKALADLTVKDVLPHGKVHTIQPETTVSDALKEMRKNKIGRLPVTGKDGALKGMISINTLLSHAIDEKKDLQDFGGKEDSLAKTIKTLFDRNNHPRQQKKEGKKQEFEIA